MRIALAAWLVVALAAPRARAETPPPPPELGLTWQAPAACPAAADVEAQFARLLGGAARTPSGKRISASVVVRAAAPDRWTLELGTTLDGAVGHRSLSGDSCASVSSAAALILALMIDPAAAERAVATPVGPPPEHAPESAPSPLAAPESVVIAKPAPAPVERPSGPFARAFAGGVFGMVPSPMPAAGVALGGNLHRFGAEVTFVATTERRVDATNASGDFRLLAGGARACGDLAGRAVLFRGCLGGEVERLSGSGVAGVVDPAHGGSALMGAGTGGLLVEVPLGRHAALALDLDAALRPYHPVFIANGATIFRVPVASGLAALGVIVSL
jgi:hypothetical protein